MDEGFATIKVLKVQRLSDKAILPTKAYPGDAGFDVYCYDDIYVTPYSNVKIPLGFAMEVPGGWVGMIAEKSGIALKNMIHTIGNVIDSSYRGEVHAIIMNTSHKTVQFKAGQKVAQLLIMPCYTGKDYEVCEELSETGRGVMGFGSTGK
jgi:dUTP pyrophosphatase